MIRVLIQVAAGSCDRAIYNEQTLEYLETQRGSHPYPYPYGFVVGTHAEDGACVDCYLITGEKLAAGAIVECEPIGLLLQDEGGEIDHKVLAVLPGQAAPPEQDLLRELAEFIEQNFAEYPGFQVRVGPLLPREAALRHLEETTPA